MNINIYSDYLVQRDLKGSFIDPESISYEECDFTDWEDKKNLKINGGDLIDVLTKCFAEDNISDVNISFGGFSITKEFVMCIEFNYFNPSNGENSTRTFYIRKVK